MPAGAQGVAAQNARGRQIAARSRTVGLNGLHGVNGTGGCKPALQTHARAEQQAIALHQRKQNALAWVQRAGVRGRHAGQSLAERWVRAGRGSLCLSRVLDQTALPAAQSKAAQRVRLRTGKPGNVQWSSDFDHPKPGFQTRSRPSHGRPNLPLHQLARHRPPSETLGNHQAQPPARHLVFHNFFHSL